MLANPWQVDQERYRERVFDIEPTARGPGRFLAQNLQTKQRNSRTTEMSTRQTQRPVDARATSSEIVVFGHSPLFYWWPVWSLGYVMALLTYLQGSATQLGDAEVMI